MQSSQITFGDRRLAGQQHAREQLLRAWESGRMSHAWLLSGPPGTGKSAFALAFAELLNGVENLTTLGEEKRSDKSGWFTHPDIHFYIPLPSTVARSEQSRASEMQERLRLLARDPYEPVDFRQKPVIDDENSSKNLQAFYPIDYFNEVIRKRCYLKPNEGLYTVVILTGIETMRREAANAFLKLLEEPPPQLLFVLTTHQPDALLPTILSRCRHVRFRPLDEETIAGALEKHDGRGREEAIALARISDGNYALARTLDPEQIRRTRSQVVQFLRNAWSEDAAALIGQIQQWHNELNTENQIALCNTFELFLRDLLIYRETQNESLVRNVDQIDVIGKFCESMRQARLERMIGEIGEIKELVARNVQFKLAFTALALRFTRLLRGVEPVIAASEPWKHLPARTVLNPEEIL